MSSTSIHNAWRDALETAALLQAAAAALILKTAKTAVTLETAKTAVVSLIATAVPN